VSTAIKTDSTLWIWGEGSFGQLGDNTTANKSSPVQTVSGGTNWKQVSAGTEGCAAIKTDGTLWLWGLGNSGQLGNNAITNRSSPVQTVSGGTNWKQVSRGDGVIAAIKTDGTLWTWGYGAYLGTNNLTDKSSPVQTISGGTNWKQVSVSNRHTMALKTDGTLWVWGRNSSGELGDNTTTSKSSPVQTVAAGTNWNQVSAGGYSTGAIKTDGTLWVWGRNDWGQLGDNTRTDKSSPVQTVSAGTNWKQVSAGTLCTAAIKTDGTLWMWGYSSHGQLGTNNTTHYSSPVQTVSGGTNWKQISIGARQVMSIRDDSMELNFGAGTL
jgi:alpha-tubulin suppressor-like RCC1 family protein